VSLLSRFISPVLARQCSRGYRWQPRLQGANTGEMNRLNKENYEEFSVGALKFLVIHIELDWPSTR